MFTKYCDTFSVVPPFACNVIPVVSPPILSFLFYYLLHALINKKGENLEYIGHLDEILCVSYQRIWKIMEILTAPKESVYTLRLSLGMDISPVYFSCSGKTGFAILSVLRIVKLVKMNLAKLSYAAVPQMVSYFHWHFFISLDCVLSADSVCSKYWIAVFLHTNLIKEKKYQAVCMSLKIWLYAGSNLNITPSSLKSVARTFQFIFWMVCFSAVILQDSYSDQENISVLNWIKMYTLNCLFKCPALMFIENLSRRQYNLSFVLLIQEANVSYKTGKNEKLYNMLEMWKKCRFQLLAFTAVFA